MFIWFWSLGSHCLLRGLVNRDWVKFGIVGHKTQVFKSFFISKLFDLDLIAQMSKQFGQINQFHPFHKTVQCSEGLQPYSCLLGQEIPGLKAYEQCWPQFSHLNALHHEVLSFVDYYDQSKLKTSGQLDIKFLVMAFSTSKKIKFPCSFYE